MSQKPQREVQNQLSNYEIRIQKSSSRTNGILMFHRATLSKTIDNRTTKTKRLPPSQSHARQFVASTPQQGEVSTNLWRPNAFSKPTYNSGFGAFSVARKTHDTAGMCSCARTFPNASCCRSEIFRGVILKACFNLRLNSDVTYAREYCPKSSHMPVISKKAPERQLAGTRAYCPKGASMDFQSVTFAFVSHLLFGHNHTHNAVLATFAWITFSYTLYSNLYRISVFNLNHW